MRIRHTHPEQHWTRLLILFITLITEALTEDEAIQALLGGNAPLNFKVDKSVIVTLTEWSRCPDEKVFVFSPVHGLSILNISYAGRLSAKSNNTIVLTNLQESDFGTYCYKVTTFPHGSLQGQIKLVKKTPDENGLPILVISVGCGAAAFIVLCGITVGVVCYRKRKRNLGKTALATGRQNRPKSTCTDSDGDGYLTVK